MLTQLEPRAGDEPLWVDLREVAHVRGSGLDSSESYVVLKGSGYWFYAATDPTVLVQMVNDAQRPPYMRKGASDEPT